MSFTAEKIMPLIHSLSEEEQLRLAEKLTELVKGKRKPKKKKKNIYDRLPAKFHPDNREMLVSMIMHGDNF